MSKAKANDLFLVAKGKTTGKLHTATIDGSWNPELVIETELDTIVDEFGDLLWWAVYVINEDFDSEIAIEAFNSYCDYCARCKT